MRYFAWPTLNRGGNHLKSCMALNKRCLPKKKRVTQELPKIVFNSVEKRVVSPPELNLNKSILIEINASGMEKSIESQLGTVVIQSVLVCVCRYKLRIEMKESCISRTYLNVLLIVFVLGSTEQCDE